VGEIPLALVALTRLDQQRTRAARFGAMNAGQTLGWQNLWLQKNPKIYQIFLDFKYRERIF
jgi:hypothetical protein